MRVETTRILDFKPRSAEGAREVPEQIYVGNILHIPAFVVLEYEDHFFFTSSQGANAMEPQPWQPLSQPGVHSAR